MKRSRHILIILPSLFAALVVMAAVGVAGADTVADLRGKIADRSNLIAELEAEIGKYEEDLRGIEKEKATLNSAIRRLDLTRKKLETDIAVTRNRIYATNLEIEKLTLEIKKQEAKIKQGNEALAGTMREMYELETSSLLEVVLSHNTVSSFWNDVNNLQRLQNMTQVRLKELERLKTELEGKVGEQKTQRNKLISLNEQLSGKKAVVEGNKKEKHSLLSVTKSKEANYQDLLEEKRAQKEAFEEELRRFEAELRIAIDPGRLPPIGSGVLAFPVDRVRITQYFGNTPFASNGAYNGNGHNGIDFGASSGSNVRAAASGTVKGTGNTDSIPGCYSYGKWVLLEHENGLSTLYAHLSHLAVSEGEAVEQGKVIGYSGNTGYSTGPHLHFTVYASQGVRIRKFENSINCKNAFIPIAPRNAYMNPLNYLPATYSIMNA